MVVQIFECQWCYALVPYPGCSHNCPSQEEDEGFAEEPDYMIKFVQALKYYRDNRISVQVVEVPPTLEEEAEPVS